MSNPTNGKSSPAQAADDRAEPEAPPRTIPATSQFNLSARLGSVGAHMSRAVVTIPPETPLIEACRLMAERRIGCVVVASGPEPLGLVSERDVVRRFARRQGLSVPVSQVMNRPLLTTVPGEPVLDALERMRDHHIRRLVVVDERGALVGIITQTDILEASSRRLVDLAGRHVKMAEAARRDELTGLFNRRAFNNFFQIELGRTRRYGGLMAMVMFDLDHFKKVNDRYGHDAGDHVLREFTRILRANCREVDIPARYGGEEFLVLMPALGTRAAALFAERIRRELAAAEMRHGEHNFRLTVSAGVCKWSKAADSLTAMHKLADQALYKAKNSGRNRVCVAAEDAARPAKHAPRQHHPRSRSQGR
jgi:diguanylate cyclase (GGDEF)-like protein